jgi:sugar (pentulose or hexulose) kinase
MTASAACAAVLDMGKTNVKLNAVTLDGHVLETVATPNVVRDGPPWRHNDLEAIGGWALAELSGLCRRHSVGHFIATGYGSGGVLVARDPDGPNGGVALPMVDYEQPLPAAVAEAYITLSGSFADRGSAIMQAATHQARQMLWMEREAPRQFAGSDWYLGLPQYWAWRFSGVARSEYSFLGAQSHLWNVVERRFSPIVAKRGWQRLLPPIAHASESLGVIRPELARRHGLPAHIEVHTGAHDSSTNFYRYQAAGMDDLIVVSTGTWIVALADRVDLDQLDESRNMTLNSDMDGHPLGGALTMGGREFTHVAGEQPDGARAGITAIASLVARGTFALPAFGADSGQFPGCAEKGRIFGPPPATPEERLALAVLYMALLTEVCVRSLGPSRCAVLDGSYLHDPAYATLVAMLRPRAETLFNTESNGIAAGAALLCGHRHRKGKAPLVLDHPRKALEIPGLQVYAGRWLELSSDFN